MDAGNKTKSKQDERPTVFQVAKDLLLLPVQILTSRSFLRTYLRAFLFFVAAVTLYSLSSILYLLLYRAYIPHQSFQLPIYLQHDHVASISIYEVRAHITYGQSYIVGATRFASLGTSSPLISGQPYDVTLHLTLPRASLNTDQGNFMVNLSLLGPSTDGYPEPRAPFQPISDLGSDIPWAPQNPVIATSSRPASLTYRSRLLSTAESFMNLPLLMVGLRKEQEHLGIQLMENVMFERDWRKIPKSVNVKLMSMERLWVYDSWVEIQARLRGLRWIMQRFKTTSFLFFTTCLWMAEMVSLVVVWGLIEYWLAVRSRRDSPRKEKRLESGGSTGITGQTDGASEEPNIKQEFKHDTQDFRTEDLSDTTRNFPSFSRQPPLTYTSPSRIKSEADDDGDELESYQQAEAASRDHPGTEADIEDEDEDEDADFVLEESPPTSRGIAGQYDGREEGGDFVDSGVGTSLESSGGATGGKVKKRNSAKK